MAGRPYGSPISLALRAAVSPAALVVAAATAAGAIFLTPWLVVPGGIIYAALVYALGPARRAARPRPPLDASALPPTIQRDLSGVRQALAGIRQAVASARAEQRPLLEGLLEEAAAVEEAAERLARSAAQLHGYLAARNETELRQRIEGLEADLGRAEDELARGQLEGALASSREELAQRDSLRGVLERWHATMRSLEASVAGAQSRVLRLAAGQLAASEADREPLPELEEMRGTIAALEEVMQHTID